MSDCKDSKYRIRVRVDGAGKKWYMPQEKTEKIVKKYYIGIFWKSEEIITEWLDFAVYGERANLLEVETLIELYQKRDMEKKTKKISYICK